MEAQPKSHPFPRHLVAIFLGIAAIIAVTGSFYYEKQKDDLLQTEFRQLAAIADLKVGQLVYWRRERQGDAEVLMKRPYFVRRVHECLKSSGMPALLRQSVRDDLEVLRSQYGYQDILILDTELKVRMALRSSGDAAVGAHTRAAAARALATGEVVFTDLYRDDPTGRIHMEAIAPLFVPQSAVPVGVCVLLINPYDFLFPLIQSWPTPSATAETLLVKSDAREVVFLNELRHRKDTALKLRFPVADDELPAAMAARGVRGNVMGRDYREVEVLAVIRNVPGFPWSVIAKIDRDEVLRDVRLRAQLMTIIVAVLILATAVSLALIWRRQQVAFYKGQYENELQRHALTRHYEYLTKYANDIIFMMDEDWIILEANERAMEVYGYRREELIGAKVTILRDPETLAEMDGQAARIAEEEGSIYETRHRRKDGAIFPVEVSARRIAVEGKTFFQTIVRDISERRAAEENLRQSEERYRNIFDNAVEGIFQSTPAGTYLTVNPAFARMYGFAAPEEMIREVQDIQFQLYVRPEDRQQVKQLLTEAGIIRGMEVAFNRKGGGTFWGSINAKAVKDAAGTIRYYDGTVDDVTERRMAEEAFRESETRFRNLFERMNSAVAVYEAAEDGADFIIRDFNAAAERMEKVRKEEILGRRVTEVFPGVREFGLFAVFQRVWRTGLAEDHDISFYHDDRISGWRENRIYKLPSGEIVAVYEDVTVRKQAEEAVRVLNEELETRVRDRTAQLEAANRELEAFSYSVSHDLRAPLRSIDGFSLALLEDYGGVLDDKGKEYLDRVRRAAQRMGCLIDDLLKLSRVTRAEFKCDVVDLSKLVRDAAAPIQQNENPRRRAELSVQDGVVVRGDRYLLMVAMTNLLDNAWKFTGRAAAPRVEFGVLNRDSESVYFVRDNGAGFDMNYAEKLFGAFQRLHSEEEFPGTGIGLATVRRIINRHGGHIWAEGEVGKGAAFYFTLPT